MADPSYPTTEQVEKLRAEIARERQQAETLMRQRLNWDEQEKFWRANADYWVLAHRQDRLRNWIAIAAVIAGVAGTLGYVLRSMVEWIP